MKITLDVQENKVAAFIEFIKTLDYVSINDNEEINEWQQEEVKRRLSLMEQGKMKTSSWEDVKASIFKK